MSAWHADDRCRMLRPTPHAMRALWTEVNAQFTDEHAYEEWATSEITWGLFDVPDRELRALGDISDLDVVELGCGTAYFSSWLAQRGPRPVGVDLTSAQLDTARRCMKHFGTTFPLHRGQRRRRTASLGQFRSHGQRVRRKCVV